MEEICSLAEASSSRIRNIGMEDHYRRLRYDPAAPVIATPYWPQPSAKLPSSGNGRMKKHPPSMARKKSKDGGSKEGLFDVPNYLKPYRDKYGSVSAHSTSAIYGALRAPHCHAMYNTTDMWYASVRSLNSRPRDVVYPAEAYDWREPVYEDLTREGCPVPTHDVLRRPHCGCMIRRKPPSSARPPPRCKYCATAPPTSGPLNAVPLSSKRSTLHDKSKLNSVSEEKEEKSEHVDRMSGYKKHMSSLSKSKPSRFSRETPSPKNSSMLSRKSILECDVTAYDLMKIPKSPSVSDSDDVDDDLRDNDMVKNKFRLRKHQSKSKSNKSGSKIESLVHRNQKVCSSKVHKLRSENNAYGDTSVFIGGQRIVTNYQSPKPIEPFVHPNHENESFTINGGSSSTRWKKLSVSEEAISIPEPDYDDSEGSEDDQMNTSKFKDLKVTYSPPLVRKSSVDDGLNLSTSREISKSMSSLLSDDTIVPNISINHPYNSSPSIRTNNSKNSSSNEDYQEEEEEEEEEKSRTELILDSLSADVSDITRVDESEDLINSSSQLYSSKHSKYESFSSSDCSSNGGTLSSDYPTWTSSSSSELKSILKKKKRRENVIQEKESTAKIFCDLESKDSQRKKQVQFLANAENSVVVELIQNTTSEVKNNGDNSEQLEAPTSPVIFDSEKRIVSNSKSVIGNDNESIYKILTATNGHNHDGGDLRSTISSEQHKSLNGSIDDYVPTEVSNKISNKSATDCIPSSQLELSDKIPPNSITKSSDFIDSTRNSNCGLVNKLAGRSSSLEDIREAGKFLHRKKKPTDAAFDDDKRRKRRTTLPKRRFSDLHLHILLCPTKSSLCGDGSSSDDVPLTTSSRRAHRSLPDSPSELEENGSSFCFEFLDKTSKDKEFPSSRSTFYVSVDGASQLENQRITEDISLLKALRNETESSKEVLPSVDGIRNNSISDDEQLDIQETDELTSPLQDDTDEDILENEYENLDPIYEELPDNISNSSKRLTSLECPQKSFFEGASKTDILSYLEDAKERGLSEGLSEDESKIIPEEDEEEETKIIINDEDEGEKNRLIVNNNINQEVLSEGDEAGTSLENIVTETNGEDTSKVNRSQTAEVERNDSGVGAETSKPSRLNKLLSADSEEQLCADCDHQVEPIEDEMSGILFSPLVCRKCDLRRCERKEIIIEFVDTELKYGRDLRIVKEEFYKPMEIAGLLSKEHLFSVFLNLEELIIFNNKFSEKLQDALDIAMEQGDEDYTTVNIGKIFLETSSMLHAFETYCVKQASASVLLSNMEKEKELLRIFLRVSQMENTLLRRMNLPAFLMVPVQRVTRYPLLLSRLHKVTPIHHKDRNALKEAQQKVELHLEHINQQTKGVGGTKIWRRISNISASHRRLGNLQDIGSIKLRKMTLEILKWKQDEVRFVMAGKLLFTQITDYPWNKKGRTVKFAPLHALLVALGKPNSNYRPEVATMDNPILFPRNTGIRDASLVLMKEKNGRFIIVRDPLYLGSCVISNCDSDSDDVFEIQEYTTKEAYLLKGESKKDTKEWLRQLRYHAKDLGSWRRRRNALANIMINGMIRP